MNGGWVFLIILIFALVGGYGGWVLFSRYRAKKNGLPPPSLNPFARSGGSAPNYPAPAPGGIKGWFDAQVFKFKNRNNRYATGAYEESGYGGPTGRGRGAGHRLDPDEAWSARVGDEAYYEEQELGLHAPATESGFSAGARRNDYEEQPRGRSRTREGGYEETRGGGLSAGNPFGDENAAPSLRGVSPRPLDHGIDTSYGGATAGHQKQGSAENSPTESRRSVFHENM